jgi:16S rRNA (guanine(966)-N(2))-methyltransferase RsmD
VTATSLLLNDRKSACHCQTRYNFLMRILAGQERGRVLRSPHGRGTRPTDSRARETLFNILGERIIGARVLDLYAGSGAVGLEALSRGAQFCVFIEQNAGAANAIRANLRMCRWNEKATEQNQPHGQVWQTNVRGALARLEEQDQTFDIIFADPPFNDPRALEDIARRVDTFARLLHNVEVLSAGKSENAAAGLMIVQHRHRDTLDLAPRFVLQKARRAGESLLAFFELANENSPVAEVRHSVVSKSFEK